MADWRKSGRADRIWQGALATSCLVHFCVIAIGWMLISKPDRLIDLKNSIRVSLVKPKPEPAVSATTINIPQQIARPQPLEPPPVKEAPVPPAQIKKPAPVVEQKPLPQVAKQVQPKPRQKAVLKPVRLAKPDPPAKPIPIAKQNPAAEVAFAKTITPDKQPAVPGALPVNLAEIPVARTSSKSAIAKPTVTTQASTVSSKAQAAVRDNYLSLLRERIDRYKKYPLMARKSRQQGVVLVEFELSTAGNLKSCQVRESCGYRLLDRAVLQAVATAAPFPEVPSQIELGEASFVVPVRFVLNR